MVGIIDDVCPQYGRRDGEGIDSRIVKIWKNFQHTIYIKVVVQRKIKTTGSNIYYIVEDVLV